MSEQRDAEIKLRPCRKCGGQPRLMFAATPKPRIVCSGCQRKLGDIYGVTVDRLCQVWNESCAKKPSRRMKG